MQEKKGETSKIIQHTCVELKKELKWVLLNAVMDLLGLLDNSGPQSEGGPPNKL